MRCPFCLASDTRVIDSRPVDDGKSIRRRRECEECSKRFTTYEKIENTPILVVKKDGRREIFDADKIMSGLLKACEKRPVAAKDLEALVDSVEKQVYNTLQQEISSKDIGEMVMEGLKELDEVAYVRFASVYRQFKDVNTFIEELRKLIDESKEN